MAMTEAQLRQRKLAGKARAKQFTKEYQKDAQAGRSSESLARGGRNGYRVACQRGFRDKALQGIKAWHATRPSNYEKIVMDLLDNLRESFERDAIVSGFIVDFITDCGLAIEVNGEVHDYFDVEEKARVQERKLEYLKGAGHPTLVLDHKEINQWKRQVEEAVETARSRIASVETSPDSEIPF